MTLTFVRTRKRWVQIFAGTPVHHPTKGWVLKNRVFPLDPLRALECEFFDLLELNVPRAFHVMPAGVSRWTLEVVAEAVPERDWLPGDVNLYLEGKEFPVLEMCGRLGGLLDLLTPGQRYALVPGEVLS